MDLKDLKLQTLGIDKGKFGRIFTFVDYGNVNYWYDKDRRNADDVDLPQNQKLIIDIEKLASFTALFPNESVFITAGIIGKKAIGTSQSRRKNADSLKSLNRFNL